MDFNESPNTEINIYARKSVFREQGESVDNQVKICMDYAKRNFGNVYEENIHIYCDDGFSGKNTDRPQFQRMMKNIQRRKDSNGYVICYKLNRISRNVADFANIIETLKKNNMNFVAVKDGVDTSTNSGKLVMYITAVFAEMERESIAENIRDHKLAMARGGHWMGGAHPTGFDVVTRKTINNNGKTKKSYFLVENEDIEKVKLIFEKFLSLGSTSAVAKYLYGEGIRSINGKEYSKMAIHHIILRPLYCTADRDAYDYFQKNNCKVFFSEKDFREKRGVMVFNRVDTKCRPKPMSEWIVSVGDHKGVISGKDWVAAQNMELKKKGYRVPTKTESFFSSILKCPVCGGTMLVKKRYCSPTFYYTCSKHLRLGSYACPSENVEGQEFDEKIINILRNYDLKEFRKRLHTARYARRVNKFDDEIDCCESKIRNFFASKEKLLAHLLKIKPGSTVVAEINSKLERLNSQIEEQKRKKQEYVLQLEEARNDQSDIAEIVQCMTKLKNDFSKLSYIERKTLVQRIIVKIELKNGEYQITFRGEE